MTLQLQAGMGVEAAALGEHTADIDGSSIVTTAVEHLTRQHAVPVLPPPRLSPPRGVATTRKGVHHRTEAGHGARATSPHRRLENYNLRELVSRQWQQGVQAGDLYAKCASSCE